MYRGKPCRQMYRCTCDMHREKAHQTHVFFAQFLYIFSRGEGLLSGDAYSIIGGTFSLQKWFDLYLEGIFCLKVSMLK